MLLEIHSRTWTNKYKFYFFIKWAEIRLFSIFDLYNKIKQKTAK